MSHALDIDGPHAARHGAAVRLADLLVSIALLGLTCGVTLVLLQQGQQAWTVGAARVEAQQSARAALTWLAAELRLAGQGGGPRSLPALSAIEPARGLVTGPGETITWRLAGEVLRRDAGGGAQPVANGVRALGLTYLDGAGLPTTDPLAVRRILISLGTRPDHAPAHSTRGLGATLTTEVTLRNR
jgi:hypothetical protein